MTLSAIEIGELFRTDAPKLRRRLAYKMRSTEDAEDVVQEAFVKALRFAANFRGEAMPSTWIDRIATNSMLNHFESHKTDKMNVSLDDAPEQAGDDVLTTIEFFRLLTEFAEIWDSFSAETKEAMNLVILDGLEYQDAAQVLGIGLPALKSRLNRARDKFRAAANLNGRIEC
jgi:RNA polymerase sigma-70 factor, ECF subfamily